MTPLLLLPLLSVQNSTDAEKHSCISVDTTECESSSQPKWPDHYSPLEQRQMIVIAF